MARSTSRGTLAGSPREKQRICSSSTLPALRTGWASRSRCSSSGWDHAVRVLVLDGEFPFPLNNGKRTRTFNLYRRLAERFQIRYVAYGDPGSAAAQAVKEAGMEPHAVPAQLPSKHGPLFYVR